MRKERHAKIIEIMENQNVISIKELAQKLGCTEMTVRRNLDELQAMNFVKRERDMLLCSALLSQRIIMCKFRRMQERKKQLQRLL